MDPFWPNDEPLWPSDDEMLKAILRRAPRGGMAGRVTGRAHKGGQFISVSDWEREKSIARAELAPRMAGFERQCQYLRQVWLATAELGDKAPKSMPTVGETRWQMKHVVREMYRDAFILGKRAGGNLFAITPDDEKACKRVRYDEFKYLNKFMEDMATGGGTMDYQQRMDYYVKASRELFWLGFARADMSADRKIWWVLGDTEHCESCLNAQKNSPYTGEQFWTQLASKQILPQSGALDCLGYYCQCSITDEPPPAYANRKIIVVRNNRRNIAQ